MILQQSQSSPIKGGEDFGGVRRLDGQRGHDFAPEPGRQRYVGEIGAVPPFDDSVTIFGDVIRPFRPPCGLSNYRH